MVPIEIVIQYSKKKKQPWILFYPISRQTHKYGVCGICMYAGTSTWDMYVYIVYLSYFRDMYNNNDKII